MLYQNSNILWHYFQNFFDDQLKSPGKPAHHEKQFYDSLEVEDADDKKEF